MSTHNNKFDENNLEAILAAAHLLSQQKSLIEVLRLLKFCCTPFWPFQREILMIEPPLQEQGRMYSLSSGNNCDCTRVDLPLEDKYTWYRQTEPTILDQANLASQFPYIAKREIFKDAKHCLLLPLPVDVAGFYAMLIFVRTQPKPFKPQILPFAKLLKSLVTSSITNLLLHEQEAMEVASLKRERDQLNILVAITNVALSTLDCEVMLDNLARDLRRFLELQDVALALLDNDRVTLFCAKNPKAISSQPPKQILPINESIWRLLSPDGPKIISQKALLEIKSQDKLTQYFLAEDHQAICQIPLTFQQQNLGFLLLAHANRDIFTRDTISLLNQIGQAVACSVKNAQAFAMATQKVERLVDENAYLSSEMTAQFGKGQIIGQSKAIQEVLYQVAMVAKSDSTVLILGETGTGKELIAEAIHAASPRKAQRMVKINCAAVPETLLESELFGHEKGAFTGAIKQTKGRFELANNSTLLLDEVGDMPLSLQPKLLRVLQERELERLGGQTVIHVDVRLVAATNQNLLDLVQKREFREDLYYRLNVFPIHLPPLRERLEDIPLLATYFMREHARRMKKDVCQITQEALDWLCRQSWPGNIRELANVIERAVILSSGKVLNLEAYATNTLPKPKVSEIKNIKNQDSYMIEEIKAAIKACNGVIAGPRGAAMRLGLNRTTLNSRMKRLGLEVKKILEED